MCGFLLRPRGQKYSLPFGPISGGAQRSTLSTYFAFSSCSVFRPQGFPCFFLGNRPDRTSKIFPDIPSAALVGLSFPLVTLKTHITVLQELIEENQKAMDVMQVKLAQLNRLLDGRKINAEEKKIIHLIGTEHRRTESALLQNHSN